MSSLLSLCVFAPAAHRYFVIDEKLTAQDKEQDDSRYDIRGIFIQVELGRNLSRALLHEYQEKGYQDHGKCIELAEP